VKDASWWIEQFKSDDAATQSEAAEVLVALGETSYPTIAKFLNKPYMPGDQRSVALSRAVTSFTHLGPSVVPALLAAIRLAAPGELGHSGGVVALVRMGLVAFPAVETALHAPDTLVRASAVVALGMQGFAGRADPGSVPAIIQALKEDTAPEVRAVAASALGAFRPLSQDAALALDEALKDHDEAVRLQAAMTLALSTRQSREPSPETAAGIPVLIESLRSRNEEARAMAAMALRALGPAGEPAIPALAEALEDPSTGSYAAQALAAMGAKGIEALQEAADGSNRVARDHAAEALGRISQQGKTQTDASL